MTLTYRDEKGSNLTPDEVDENFRDLAERVAALETYGGAAETITNVTVNGSLLTVYTSGGQEFTATISIPRAPAVVAVSDVTREAVLTDADKFLNFTSAAGCALTIPDEDTVAWNADTEIRVRQGAAGAVTIAGGTGVTITPKTGFDLETGVQGGVVYLKKIATDSWIAWGDLAQTSA